jgi:radical SAM superfamily enzyme YgiQ (UPF0313 family)
LHNERPRYLALLDSIGGVVLLMDYLGVHEPSPPNTVAGQRVILVNSGNRFVEGAMPLGLMALATSLQRQYSVSCEILDLPLEHKELLESQIACFWRWVDLRNVLFVGFGSICNTMPRTLSLARALKMIVPGLKIIFGGPEASARASSWMDAYPFIDGIVVGEAESVLPDLLRALETGAPPHSPGLLFRNPSKCAPPVIGDRGAAELAPIVNLNHTEPTDYLTYAGGPLPKSVQIEVGRGCPYACTFCSTKDFFRRRFRLKSPARIVSEVAALAGSGNVRHFDFVHDMFTTNRKLVVEVCEALIASGLDITWGCSARTDRIDSDLLSLMMRAGCRDIYFGVETGSARIQEEIQKNLNLDDAISKLRLVHSMGFRVTASLIIGFPNEHEEDLIDTLNLVLRLRSWRPRLESVQVHLLAPLAGTELTTCYSEKLLYDGHLSATTSVNCLTQWEDTQIRTHPNLFSSFYYFSNPHIERSVYKLLHWALTACGEELQHSYDCYQEHFGAVLLSWARSRGSYPVNGEVQWTPASWASFLPCGVETELAKA